MNTQTAANDNFDPAIQEYAIRVELDALRDLAEANEPVRFEVGSTYSTGIVAGSKIRMCDTIIRRTPKTVWLSGGKSCKIHVNDGVEIIYPEGRFSMAPVYRATSTA